MITHAGEEFIVANQFTESKLGKTGLTVVCNLWRVTLSSAAVSQVVTDGACTEVGGGIYFYKHASTAGAAYYYFGTLKTATTSVDSRELPAMEITGIPFVERIDVASSTINTAVSDLADQVDTWFADTTPILNKVDSTLVLDTGSVYQFTANALELGTGADKTGYKLAADGLDLITASAPTGVANTFPKMLVQMWWRMFKKSQYDRLNNTIKTFNGATVITTQSATTVAQVETVGDAS